LSTNYYYRPLGAIEYNDDDHIGLSISTMFTFRALPEQGLVSYAAWRKKLLASDVEIVNEYGQPIPKETFFQMVEDDAAAAANVIYRNSDSYPAGAKIPPDVVRYRDEAGHMFDRRNIS